MRPWKILPTVVLIGLALALTARYGRGDTPSEASPATESPVLKTQQFESGELRLPDVESERLEAFLRDLNHRRDYDFSQHDPQRDLTCK